MFSKRLANTERHGHDADQGPQSCYTVRCPVIKLGKRNGETDQHYILINPPSYHHLIFQTAAAETVSLLGIILRGRASRIHIWSSNITFLISRCVHHILSQEIQLLFRGCDKSFTQN